MQYNIGICDDEKLQLKLNNVYLKEIAGRNQYQVNIKAFMNSTQLFSYLQIASLDILFLDIDLGEESGIEIAQKLAATYPKIIVVFLTGHREFANDAFDVEALGYVLKPIEEQKLERILTKAITQVLGIKNKTNRPSLVVTVDNLKKKIIQDDILYIERVLSKSIIHTRNKEYQVYEPLTSICQRLDHTFLRINQSEVISSSEILKLEGNTVYLKNGKELSIGRTFKKAVYNSFYQ